MTFGSDSVTVNVPFQTVSLTVNDAAGITYNDALIHVYYIYSSPFISSSTVTLPTDASTSFRAEVDGTKGPWIRKKLEENVDSVAITF